jgi:hypothetical protein
MDTYSLSAPSLESRRLWLFLATLLSVLTALSAMLLSVGPTAVSAYSNSALSCPANLAGKFVAGWSEGEPAFQWYKFFGENAFTAADTLKLSFAIVPPESGTTLVALDEIDGRTGYQFYFTGGLVNGVVPYTGNVWNIVEIEFDFDTKQYVIAVNKIPSAPIPFDYDDSNSAQALRVHFSGVGAEEFAWFDSISVVRSSGASQTVLFQATFDTGAIHSASPGTITSLEPPDSYGVPAPCTSVTTLIVNPTMLEFTAVVSGSNPAIQSIFVADNGVVSLPWTAVESIDWLSLSSTQGTTPAEVEVSVDVGALDPGVYTGQITVNSDIAELGSPQPVYVSLTIYPATPPPNEPCPEGRAGRFTGEWYEHFGEHYFTPTDTLTLAFSIVPSPSETTLVAMDDADGRTGYQVYFYNGIVYDADHGNNFANDTPLAAYNAGKWNTVQAHYDFTTHKYTLSVNGIVTGSIPFSFSDLNSVQALRIHTSSGAAWIDTLSVEREGDMTPLYHNAFDGGALPEDYALPATCSSSGSMLEVDPTTLEFSAFEGDSELESQFVSIDDNGTGPLHWTASESIDWLSLSSTESETPSTIQVSVDVSGLGAGEYSGPIMLASNDAQNSPQTVTTHLLVEPSTTAHIALSAESGYDNVRLDWNPTNNPNVTTYRVWRAVDGIEEFTAIAVISDTTYLDDDPALAIGTSYCYYVEALLSNSTVVRESNVDCAVFGQVELWIPNTWAAQGQTRIVPINIRNATSLRIAAADIWLNFDSTVIKLLDISETPLTIDYTWTYAVTSTGTYSQAHIAAFEAGAPTLYGEGALFWLSFQVVGSEGEESPLHLQEFIEGVGGSAIYTPDDLISSVPLQLQSSVFHVADGGVLGDLNGNGVVQAVDTYMALKAASGEFTLDAEQLLAGDVNSNGVVDAGDATMTLYYAVHGTWPTPAPSGVSLQSIQEENNSTVLLSLNDASGIPGDIVQTTLRAENLSDWAGGEFVIAYDTQVISGINDVHVTDLASGFAMQYHDDGAGLLHIALASNTPTSGSGALARISLHTAPTALNGRTTLALAAAYLNDVAGRDFATSALQQTIRRCNGVLQLGFHVYLPAILK